MKKTYLFLITYFVFNNLFANNQNNKSNNELFFAISKCNYKKIKDLIEKGADVNIKFKENSPLGMALINRCPENIISLLLQNGANANSSFKVSHLKFKIRPLYFAILEGLSASIIKKLLSFGAKITKDNIESLSRMGGALFYTPGFSSLLSIIKIEQDLNSQKKISPNLFYDTNFEDLIWLFNRIISKYQDNIDLLPVDYKQLIDIYQKLLSSNISRCELFNIAENLKQEISNKSGHLKDIYEEFLKRLYKIIALTFSGLSLNAAAKTVFEFV